MALNPLSRLSVLPFTRIDNGNGLIAWYPFTDNSGNDQSGIQNNGVINGAIERTIGVGGYSLKFTGSTTQFVNISSFVDCTQTLTIAAWLTWLGAVFCFEQEIFVQDVANNNFRFCIAGSRDTGNTGKLRFIYTPSTAASVYSTGVIPGTDTPTHIAVTKNGTAFKFYINGALDSSPTGANIGTNSSITSRISCATSDTVVAPYNGSIGDFRVYNRDLSAQEINSIYNVGWQVANEYELQILQAQAAGASVVPLYMHRTQQWAG